MPSNCFGRERSSTYRSRVGLRLPTRRAPTPPAHGARRLLVPVLLRWTRRRVTAAGSGLLARNEVVEAHVERREDGRHILRYGQK